MCHLAFGNISVAFLGTINSRRYVKIYLCFIVLVNKVPS
jgi:hypothetical protein